GQQSTRTAPTGRTHDCKRPLRCTPNDLLPDGGHPHMRRRDFITVLGGAAAAWPLSARAQQPAMPVIGFVYPGVPELSAGIVSAFRKGLNETGFIEGRNVTVEFRFAYNDNARLPELVGDLVQRGVAVIATPASTPAALAAKAGTATVPIVFGVGADPVEI